MDTCMKKACYGMMCYYTLHHIQADIMMMCGTHSISISYFNFWLFVYTSAISLAIFISEVDKSEY